jgi:MFS family permease
MGLGEGVLFPSLHQIAGSWYPLQERSYLVALVASGIDLGTILSLVVAPLILNAWGWPWIFGVFGALSLLWVLAFAVWGYSRPEDDPHISGQELDFIQRNRTADHPGHVAVDADEDKSAVDWRVLLGSRAAWAVYVAHICTNYSWYVLLGWSPQYCQQVLKIDLDGGVAAIPYVAGYAGTMLFGRLGDWFVVTYGARELHVRQGMNALSLLGSAFFLYSLRFAQSAGVAVTLMAFALFTSRASNAGFWVNMIDIGAPSHAAHVMGVSNTLATIPGIVGNVVTGKILAATGDWNMVFGVAAAVAVVGAVVFHFNASDESIFARPDEQRVLETGKHSRFPSSHASTASSATSLSGASPEADHLLPKATARQAEDSKGVSVVSKYS